MGYRLGFAFLFLFAQTAFAKITAEILMYKSWAHREADKGRDAEGFHGAAEVRVETAIYRLDLQSRLFAKNASTAWDISQANLNLAKAKLALGKAEAELATARAMEQVWLRYAEASEKETDPAKEVASLIADSRKAQQTAAKTAVDNIKKISFEVNYQYQKGKALLAKQAISREEFFNLQVASDEANVMIKTAETELMKATAILDEALRDLDSLVRP